MRTHKQVDSLSAVLPRAKKPRNKVHRPHHLSPSFRNLDWYRCPRRTVASACQRLLKKKTKKICGVQRIWRSRPCGKELRRWSSAEKRNRAKARHSLHRLPYPPRLHPLNSIPPLDLRPLRTQGPLCQLPSAIRYIHKVTSKPAPINLSVSTNTRRKIFHYHG